MAEGEDEALVLRVVDEICAEIGAAAVARGRLSAPMRGRVLVVAGSDSGGGAGIQADIKTITALGAYAMTAVTAITVQDTRGVHCVHAVPPAIVAAQMACVLDDIGADAIKTGMLGERRGGRGGLRRAGGEGARRAAGGRSGDGGQGRRRAAGRRRRWRISGSACCRWPR